MGYFGTLKALGADPCNQTGAVFESPQRLSKRLYENFSSPDEGHSLESGIFPNFLYSLYNKISNLVIIQPLKTLRPQAGEEQG
jgi:hypothetical protein